jgi:uncharacterized UPF0160 family protein
MKLKIFFYLFILNLAIFSCAQDKHSSDNTEKAFTNFIEKEKFNKDEALLYNGLSDKNLKPVLNKELNRIAETFKFIQSSKNPSDEIYQKAIQIGLKPIEKLELDTEDRTRVANYIEELMDIVGLKSSNGILNNYVYGFDPTKK